MSPVVPTLPTARIGRRPMCSPMLTGFRSSSLSTWSCGSTTRSSRRFGVFSLSGDGSSTSRSSVSGRDAMTRSGPMPYQSSAAGRMKCTPLPEQIQTANPFASSSATSSFIGW